MTIDHTCRVRSCVNVDHLEVVTAGENMRRARALVVGGECLAGHPVTDESLYHRARGGAECRECRAEAVRRSKAKAAA